VSMKRIIPLLVLLILSLPQLTSAGCFSSNSTLEIAESSAPSCFYIQISNTSCTSAFDVRVSNRCGQDFVASFSFIEENVSLPLPIGEQVELSLLPVFDKATVTFFSVDEPRQEYNTIFIKKEYQNDLPRYSWSTKFAPETIALIGVVVGAFLLFIVKLISFKVNRREKSSSSKNNRDK